MYKIILTNEASKNIKKLPNNIIEKAKNAIREIVKTPYDSAKPLKGILKGQYSYRIGDYRLVYVVYNKEKSVYLLYVRHRKDAYR